MLARLRDALQHVADSVGAWHRDYLTTVAFPALAQWRDALRPIPGSVQAGLWDDLKTVALAVLAIGIGGELFEWLGIWGLPFDLFVPVVGLIVAGAIAYTRARARERSRRNSALFSAAVVVAALVIYARLSAWWGVPKPLVRSRLEPGIPSARVASAPPILSLDVRPDLQPAGGPADTRALIVLVHGFHGLATKGFRQLVKEIHNCRPGDDLLPLSFPTRMFSNADPALIADEMNGRIEEQFRRRDGGEGYKEVILVGHSIGALLVRKAYLYGRGLTDDAPGWPMESPPRPWAKKVRRIVLLAGVNRGWKSDPSTLKAGSWARALAYPIETFAWMSGTAELFRGFEAGSPFVANLRLQWIRLPPSTTMPTVVQLLGVEDELVGVDDNKDVAVNRDFIFVPVRGSNHTSILDFDDPDHGEGRRTAFDRAMDPDPSAIHRLGEEFKGETFESDGNIKTVVFVLHGIRDMGQWTDRFEEAFLNTPAGKAKSVKVLRPRYGFFPMGPFLLIEDRQKYVRWFVDEYTEARARYPGAADDINFIGHSNGAYVLASALAQYRTLRINRAMFAGSVVPRDYDWADRLKRKQVRSVRNDLGSADWVVAIFPRMVELFHEWFGIVIGPSDIGSGGFNGFLAVGGPLQENYYLRGGHGAALQEPNTASIVDFVLQSPEPKPPAPVVPDQSSLVLNLSRFCWLVWAGIGLGVVLGYAILRLVFRGLNGLYALAGLPRLIPDWAMLPLYLLMLLAILYSF